MMIQSLYDKFFSKLSKQEQEFFQQHERPEQEMLFKYLPRQCTVLEIGGGCGQTACVIDSILDDVYRDKHIVIEPSLNAFHRVKQLKEKIGAKFQLKHGFLATDRSKQELLWEDCKKVMNFTLQDLHLSFDVISADCEGAFIPICEDFPELLQNASLVFLENDGDTPKHRKMLQDNGFTIIHTQAHPYYNLKEDQGWTGRKTTVQELLKEIPSMLYFHEVWAKL
jgi:hypothetical protein